MIHTYAKAGALDRPRARDAGGDADTGRSAAARAPSDAAVGLDHLGVRRAPATRRRRLRCTTRWSGARAARDSRTFTTAGYVPAVGRRGARRRRATHGRATMGSPPNASAATNRCISVLRPRARPRRRAHRRGVDAPPGDGRAERLVGVEGVFDDMARRSAARGQTARFSSRDLGDDRQGAAGRARGRGGADGGAGVVPNTATYTSASTCDAEVGRLEPRARPARRDARASTACSRTRRRSRRA